jgi:hypothetical protein
MIIHEYVAACTKALYEEYGQIDTTLMLQGIQSLGVHFEGGFRGNDGKVYHHMILVMSPHLLGNLHELFPGITTQWTHKTHEQDGTHTKYAGPIIPRMEKGKLLIETKDATFRA